jgi:CheY-like chemotaxis protein
MMRSILKEDFKIRVATSGAKALDLVKAEPHPELILLDVMMPQMDGYEVRVIESLTRSQRHTSDFPYWDDGSN